MKMPFNRSFPRARFVSLLILAACAGLHAGCTHQIKVIPTPSESDVTFDGNVVGHGVTNIVLHRAGAAYEVGIVPPPGYFPKKTLVSFESPRTLDLHAERDSSYFETVEQNDVVNKWIVLRVSGNYEPLDAWHRLVSSVSNAIADFEVLDQKSLYLKSAWKIAGRRGEYLRTRSRIIVSVENAEPKELSFKFRIESDRINRTGDIVQSVNRTYKTFLDALETARSRLAR